MTQPPLRLLASLAIMGAMRALADRFTAAGGPTISADFAPTLALLERLRGGEAADLAILTREGLAELLGEGLVAGDTPDIAVSRVGLAVAAGAAHPDIADAQALRETLLAAGSVAYSRIGASGVFFAGLLERLGIAAAVNARARIVPSGLTAECLLRGEAELAVQQISELMLVPGVEIVGPLPAALQVPAVFAAGRLAASRHPDADRLRQFLAAPEVAAELRRCGLEPPA